MTRRFGSLEKVLFGFLKTDFEKQLLEGCFTNLQDPDNKLSFNNFAYSIRELARHMLERFSPNDKVRACQWYTSQIPNKPDGVTRGQRIKYAVQGGMSDQFVLEDLDLDLNALNKTMTKALDKLSKYTHVDTNTFGLSRLQTRLYVQETVEAFELLFNTIAKCKARIIKKIENRIDLQVLNHAVETTFDEIHALATHYWIDYTYISDISISSIDHEEIHLIVSGEIAVQLQYGSDADARNGDGAQFGDAFPFTCELGGAVNQLEDFEAEVDSMNVNTDSFYQ